MPQTLPFPESEFTIRPTVIPLDPETHERMLQLREQRRLSLEIQARDYQESIRFFRGCLNAFLMVVGSGFGLFLAGRLITWLVCAL